MGSKYLGLPNFVLAPPPDYDLPKSKLSLDKVADLRLKSLLFTHNGPYYLARDDDFFPRLKRQHDLWVGTLADLLDQFLTEVMKKCWSPSWDAFHISNLFRHNAFLSA